MLNFHCWRNLFEYIARVLLRCLVFNYFSFSSCFDRTRDILSRCRIKMNDGWRAPFVNRIVFVTASVTDEQKSRLEGVFQ